MNNTKKQIKTPFSFSRESAFVEKLRSHCSNSQFAVCRNLKPIHKNCLCSPASEHQMQQLGTPARVNM